MIKNYFLVSIRAMGRNFLFILANIIGLALALCIGITSYMNNKFAADFDKTHENYEQIYKISITREIQGRQQDYGITPVSLGMNLQSELSVAKEVTRFHRSYSPIKYDHKIFNKRIGYVDPNFLDVFTLQFIEGSATALKEKNQILINKRLANIYFGEEEAFGKIISVVNDKGEEYSFTVGGVFENLPLNSSFRFEALTQLDNFVDMWGIKEDDWKVWTAATFLLVDDEDKLPEIQKKLDSYIEVQNKARENWKISSFFIEPLAIIPETSRERWADWLMSGFHPAAVLAPPIMALFILLIACFNFMNTSIAFAGRRLMEIGVRKAVGGLRIQIIIQFLLENLFVSLLALILGVFLSYYLVPAYSSMWEYMELVMDFGQHPALWLFLIILLFGTSLLAGAYPAFYVSRFNPVNIFRGRRTLGGRNRLSKTLLGLQFFISMMALVAGVVFTQNAYYQESLDFGYKKNEVLVLPINNPAHYKAMEEAAKANPMIQSVAGSEEHIGNGNYSRTIKEGEKPLEVSFLDVGHDYLETMGLKLLDGRDFKLELESTDKEENSIIINEKMATDLGWKNPVGKRFFANDTIPMTVIGVVKNFYLYGFWSELRPTAFLLAKGDRHRHICIRAKEENLKKVNEYLKTSWAEIIPNYPYEGFFQVELMDEAKQVNQNIKKMFVFLAIIACLLSALGLFTLVSLNILKRVKEIGIRKVMGASVFRIMRLINRPFAIIILIASLTGCVAGYYVTNLLMASVFKQYTPVNFLSFALPVALIFAISTLTISFKVYKAALQNPALSLRYE